VLAEASHFRIKDDERFLNSEEQADVHLIRRLMKKIFEIIYITNLTINF
tara:strand:+ start:298 stop:444 length:147 start_codon:yes stop_codon:yes gene_type:complete